MTTCHYLNIFQMALHQQGEVTQKIPPPPKKRGGGREICFGSLSQPVQNRELHWTFNIVINFMEQTGALAKPGTF